jgi:hypothetical protein
MYHVEGHVQYRLKHGGMEEEEEEEEEEESYS